MTLCDPQFFLFTLNSDLRSSSPTTQHLISTAEGLTLAREVKAGFCEVSCKNNIGVKEFIEHAVGLYAVFKRCHMYIHRSSKLMLCLIVFKTAMNSLDNLIVLYIRMLINCKKLSRTFKICVPWYSEFFFLLLDISYQWGGFHTQFSLKEFLQIFACNVKYSGELQPECGEAWLVVSGFYRWCKTMSDTIYID